MIFKLFFLVSGHRGSGFPAASANGTTAAELISAAWGGSKLLECSGARTEDK